ncbi:porphobilinogen synthase [Aquirhabdus sp.]|uniref:porphobilinogen synthase n=1 Tax=Aquirhabdus sp. TaxID=2824160 RepID=UPI00396C8E77
MKKPLQRLRRLRKSRAIRDLLRESHFSLADLVQPIFIEEEITEPVPIHSMPGIFRLPEQDIEQEVKALYALGIRCVMPFGVSHRKDHIGSDTWSETGLLVRMIQAIKHSCPEMIVIPDICFCEYTTHGHCGVVLNDQVCNDLTLENLVKQSLAAAKAGADMLAPSGMMDGQVAAIREALDIAGYQDVAIMAHAIKFASALYGPFRAAVDSQMTGDRHSYQLDYANARQAMHEAALDESEGADILIVKPGMFYLDVLSRLRAKTQLPLAAYQVGGEYAAIKFAALANALDERKTVLESIIAFKRAGADVVITYFAKDIATWHVESEDL